MSTLSSKLDELANKTQKKSKMNIINSDYISKLNKYEQFTEYNTRLFEGIYSSSGHKKYDFRTVLKHNGRYYMLYKYPDATNSISYIQTKSYNMEYDTTNKCTFSNSTILQGSFNENTTISYVKRIKYAENDNDERLFVLYSDKYEISKCTLIEYKFFNDELIGNVYMNNDYLAGSYTNIIDFYFLSRHNSGSNNKIFILLGTDYSGTIIPEELCYIKLDNTINDNHERYSIRLVQSLFDKIGNDNSSKINNMFVYRLNETDTEISFILSLFSLSSSPDKNSTIYSIKIDKNESGIVIDENYTTDNTTLSDSSKDKSIIPYEGHSSILFEIDNSYNINYIRTLCLPFDNSLAGFTDLKVSLNKDQNGLTFNNEYFNFFESGKENSYSSMRTINQIISYDRDNKLINFINYTTMNYLKSYDITQYTYMYSNLDKSYDKYFMYLTENEKISIDNNVECIMICLENNTLISDFIAKTDGLYCLFFNKKDVDYTTENKRKILFTIQ